jgi:four helix bundle protein
MQNQKTKIQNYIPNSKSDLKWRAFNFSIKTIEFVNSFPNTRLYWTFSDQLLRSATSAGANINEAKASSSKKDFIRYYEIALKSANETEYWLLLLKESNLVKNEKIISLINEINEISKMLGSSLLTLKGKRN